MFLIFVITTVLDVEKALTEILKNYHKKIIKNSTNVLKDLQQIVQDCEEKEFERIHLHFSGIDHKLVFTLMSSYIRSWKR